MTPIELKILQEEIERYFKQDIDYSIQDGQEIVSKNKKSQSFISTIN